MKMPQKKQIKTNIKGTAAKRGRPRKTAVSNRAFRGAVASPQRKTESQRRRTARGKQANTYIKVGGKTRMRVEFTPKSRRKPLRAEEFKKHEFKRAWKAGVRELISRGT